MPEILFICTANRFRSALAEAAMRKQLQQTPQAKTCRVLSAGTWTVSGLPAMPEAIQAGLGIGLDLSTHLSQPVDSHLLASASLVLVMDHGHLEALLTEFPQSADKIKLLSEFQDGTGFDIPDPYFSQESPELIAKEIFTIIQNNWQKICSLAEENQSA